MNFEKLSVRERIDFLENLNTEPVIIRLKRLLSEQEFEDLEYEMDMSALLYGGINGPLTDFLKEKLASLEIKQQGNINALLIMKHIAAKENIRKDYNEKCKALFNKIKPLIALEKDHKEGDFVWIKKFIREQNNPLKYMQVIYEELCTIQRRIFTLWALTKGNSPYLPYIDEKGTYIPFDIAKNICQFI